MSTPRGPEVVAEKLEKARAEHARLLEAAEAYSRPRSEYETDMATVSGIRRKPSPRADRQRWARFDREAEMWAKVRRAGEEVKRLEAMLAAAKHNVPVPFTADELKAAKYVRDRFGWHRVVRVNAKSVTVETGYSWTDRLSIESLVEVRAS